MANNTTLPHILAARVAAVIDKLLGFSALAAISLMTLLIVAMFLNPAKFGSYLWVISKLCLAAALGELFYRAMTSRAERADGDGLTHSMAQTQRATLIAASIIAAGLMP